MESVYSSVLEKHMSPLLGTVSRDGTLYVPLGGSSGFTTNLDPDTKRQEGELGIPSPVEDSPAVREVSSVLAMLTDPVDVRSLSAGLADRLSAREVMDLVRDLLLRTAPQAQPELDARGEEKDVSRVLMKFHVTRHVGFLYSALLKKYGTFPKGKWRGTTLPAVPLGREDDTEGLVVYSSNGQEVALRHFWWTLNVESRRVAPKHEALGWLYSSTTDLTMLFSCLDDVMVVFGKEGVSAFKVRS